MAMVHLSVQTDEVNPEAVRLFSCPYGMGDSFTVYLSEVDCPSCLRQLKILRFFNATN